MSSHGGQGTTDPGRDRNGDSNRDIQGTEMLAAALSVDTSALPRRGSHQAFRIEGTERVWLVLDGALDLFLAGESAQGEPGRRRLLVTLSSGTLCFGAAGSPEAPAPLAVPRNGCKLAETSLAQLMALVTDQQLRVAIAEGVDHWVRALGATAGLASSPPRLRIASAPAQLTLSSGEAIQAGCGLVLWVLGGSDSLRVRDQTESAPPSGVALPITHRHWVRAAADTGCTLVSTESLLQGQAAAQSIAAYQAWILTARQSAIARGEAAERSRAAAYERASTRQVDGSLWALAFVLDRRRRAPVALSANPLINAIWILADHFALPRPEVERLRPALAAADPILALTQRAGLFTRAVELDEGWWRDDHGPLIVPDRSGGGLSVLLPRKGRGYDCIDPTTGVRRRMNAEHAARLDTEARTLYRPFPDRELKPSEILKFGLRGSSREAAIVVALILAVGLLSLTLPLLTELILDPIIPLAETGQLLVVVIAILVAGFAQQGFSLLQGLFLLRMEGRVTMQVEAAVWDRLLKLPSKFFRDYSAGDLANRAMSVDAMRRTLSGIALSSITHGVVGLFSVGLMLYYQWRLTLGVLVVVLVYAVFAVYAGRRVMSLNRAMLKLGGQLQGTVLHLLEALTKLRVAGGERNAFSQWAGSYARLQSLGFEQQGLENALTVFKAGFMNFALVAVILMISWQGHEILAFYRTPETWAEVDSLSLQEIMPTGRFVAFHVAFGHFMGATFGLIEVLVQFSIIPAYYERFQPILSAATEADSGAADPGEVRGDIELESVSFRYGPDEPLVLKEVSLHAAPGDLIAIVGPSGAGKSSLMHLILGFDAPESGSVYLDGKDIASLDKHAMRRSLGVVLQSGRLLAGTLYQNIAGGAQLSRDQVMEAVRLAGLEQDVEAMPMGLDTHLSEGATTLSGGQRQRLMIARAIVNRPRVLLFDEATSALDNDTQETVTRSLNALNSTRILIAHRLSTVIDADRIYVLDKGELVESGNYRELMAKDGLFAAMARRQIL